MVGVSAQTWAAVVTGVVAGVGGDWVVPSQPTGSTSAAALSRRCSAWTKATKLTSEARLS